MINEKIILSYYLIQADKCHFTQGLKKYHLKIENNLTVGGCFFIFLFSSFLNNFGLEFYKLYITILLKLINILFNLEFCVEDLKTKDIIALDSHTKLRRFF